MSRNCLPSCLFNRLWPFRHTRAASVVLILLSGCVTTAIPIASTLPYHLQQDIRSIDTTEMAFQFVPSESAETIETRIAASVISVRYSINQATQSLIRELLETKFGRLSADSRDRLLFEITHYSTRTDGLAHELNMAVRMTINTGEQTQSKAVAYSTTVLWKNNPETDDALLKQGIEDLLLKFVVAADQFLDAYYAQ